MKCLQCANIVAYAVVQTSKSAESQFLSDVTKGMPLWPTYMFLKDQVKDDVIMIMVVMMGQYYTRRCKNNARTVCVSDV